MNDKTAKPAAEADVAFTLDELDYLDDAVVADGSGVMHLRDGHNEKIFSAPDASGKRHPVTMTMIGPDSEFGKEIMKQINDLRMNPNDDEDAEIASAHVIAKAVESWSMYNKEGRRLSGRPQEKTGDGKMTQAAAVFIKYQGWKIQAITYFTSRANFTKKR